MRKPKSLPDKRRRLTQREESAVALIALRMVVAEREWNPGDAPVVRMLDMMFRVLEYQIAAKAFGAWLTRLGMQTLRRGGRKLVVVPVNFDEAESALRKLTGAGHTLATAVKASILAQAVKMTTDECPTVNIAGSGRGPIPVCPEPAARNDDFAGVSVDRDTPAKAGKGSGYWPDVFRNSDDVAAQRGVIPARQQLRKPLNDFLDEEED